jgi:hemolysin D
MMRTPLFSLPLRLAAWRDLGIRYARSFRHAWAARTSLDGPHYHPDEAEFLAAALALQRTPPSPASRVALWLICAFALITLLWSIVGKVDVVASAPGKVVPSGRSKPIQAIETASVQRIHVREGDVVRAGDLLIELDGSATGADTDRLQSELIAARLMMLRAQAMLGSLRSGQPPTVHSTDMPPARVLDTNRQLDGVFSEYRAQLSRLDSDIERRHAELQSIQESIRKLEKVLPITTQRAHDYQNLLGQGYVSRHAWMEKEQLRLDQDGELATQRSRLAEVTAALKETQGQRSALIAEHRRRWLDAAEEGQQKADSLQQELHKASARHQRMRVTAPMNGSIQQLSVNTVGAVVTPAQVLMLLVPSDQPMEIDAQLPNKDIGFVGAGQSAAIKVETFPYTRYGTLRGRVLHVSRDAIHDDKLGLTYLAKIQLEKSYLGVNGHQVPLQAGMAVTAEINTGQRRVIEYLLSPVLEHVNESLRER